MRSRLSWRLVWTFTEETKSGSKAFLPLTATSKGKALTRSMMNQPRR